MLIPKSTKKFTASEIENPGGDAKEAARRRASMMFANAVQTSQERMAKEQADEAVRARRAAVDESEYKQSAGRSAELSSRRAIAEAGARDLGSVTQKAPDVDLDREEDAKGNFKSPGRSRRKRARFEVSLAGGVNI